MSEQLSRKEWMSRMADAAHLVQRHTEEMRRNAHDGYVYCECAMAADIRARLGLKEPETREGMIGWVKADLHDELRRLAQAVVDEVKDAGELEFVVVPGALWPAIEALRAHLARKETP